MRFTISHTSLSVSSSSDFLFLHSKDDGAHSPTGGDGGAPDRSEGGLREQASSEKNLKHEDDDDNDERCQAQLVYVVHFFKISMLHSKTLSVKKYHNTRFPIFLFFLLRLTLITFFFFSFSKSSHNTTTNRIKKGDRVCEGVFGGEAQGHGDGAEEDHRRLKRVSEAAPGRPGGWLLWVVVVVAVVVVVIVVVVAVSF